ncbi:unnamed protein product [Mytilus edulis]|uniref:Farnesoic acid O-methyl transferase domain-containing protein n=1 Tax=Mytilus edulis TaxID=6550 RepID=A0A8S3UPT7_MYTED|nr:unnamed protein product [Mytilus edulis]
MNISLSERTERSMLLRCRRSTKALFLSHKYISSTDTLSLQTLQTYMTGNRIDEIVIETLTNRDNYSSASVHDKYIYYTSLTPFGLVPPISENVTSFEMNAGCQGGCILLNDVANLEGNNSYEICFNAFHNLIYIARMSGDDSVVLKTVDKPEILTICDDYTQVWVTWKDGVIGFGTGSIGLNEKITTTDSKPFRVYGVGVTSFLLGVWKVNIKAIPTGYYCAMTYTYCYTRLLSVSTQKIRTYCASECQKSNDCVGFNYRYGRSLNCELIEGGNKIETEDDYEWHYYAKCLQDKTACLKCR